MVELILFIVCITSVSLKKSYHYLSVTPPSESEKRIPKQLHITLKHLSFVSILLDIVTLSAFTLFAISISFSFGVNWSFLVILAGLIVIFILLPRAKTRRISKKLAVMLANPLAHFLYKFERPVSKIERLITRTNQRLHKPELFTKNALLSLLKEQKSLAHGDIKIDLNLALAGLNLNSQKVGYLMVRKQKAKTVSINEPVGPILLSELHDTGRNVFAANNKDSEIIGTIRLDRLAELKSGGKASEVLNKQIIKIHRNEPVLSAIKKFSELSAELLFVEDDTGEIIGTVYLEDVLKTLFEDTINSD